MSDKVKVSEIATELGIKSKEVVDKATEMGIEVKAANSSVSMEEAEKIMNFIMNPTSFTPPKPKPVIKKAPKKEPEPVAEEASEPKEEKTVQQAPETKEETPKEEAPKAEVKAEPKEEKADRKSTR